MNKTILHLAKPITIILIACLGYTGIGYLTYIWFSTIAGVGQGHVANRTYDILGFVLPAFILNALIIVAGLPLIFLSSLCLDHVLHYTYVRFLRCEKKKKNKEITPLVSGYLNSWTNN